MREVTPIHLYAACVPKAFRDITDIKPTSAQRNLWQWVKDIEPGAPWAYVLGTRSSGKTRMATVAVHKMLEHEGTGALYLTSSQLAKLVRSISNEDAAVVLQTAGDVDLFVIDGLGDEYRSNTSSHFHDTVTELLYDRRDRSLTTMVTSRYERTELADKVYGKNSQLVELLNSEVVRLFEIR